MKSKSLQKNIAEIKGVGSKVKEELNKMIKDSKNKEFLDVIYFGLAELNKREGNIEKAISLYIKSTSSLLVSSS